MNKKTVAGIVIGVLVIGGITVFANGDKIAPKVAPVIQSVEEKGEAMEDSFEGNEKNVESKLSEREIEQRAEKLKPQGQILYIERESDDGRPEFEVYMKEGGETFQLTVDGNTGELLEEERDRLPEKAGKFSPEEAVKKAKKEIQGGKVISTDFDTDDGIPSYELILIKDNEKYEVKIHGDTGEVLETERDE